MAVAGNKVDVLRDAEDYVESVLSSQVSMVLRTPLPSGTGRKRQLSMPDESVMKKVKSDSADERCILSAKRALYGEGQAFSTSNEKSGESKDQRKSTVQPDNELDSDTNADAAGLDDSSNNSPRNAGTKDGTFNKSRKSEEPSKTGSSKNKKKPKDKKKPDSEVIVTDAEVHVDGDISHLDTRELLMKVYSQMQNNFSVLGKRIDSIEANLEKKLTDKMTKVIDKRISSESVKLKKDMENKVHDIRKEFEADLDEISEKVANLSSQRNNDGIRETLSSHSDELKLNIVVRKLPETMNENLDNKVNSLIKDGLKLRDIEVRSTERKQSHSANIPGVVVAKLRNIEDKKKIMTAKAILRHDRRYKDIFIHNDQTKEERLMSANLRSLVNAYRSGDSNIQIKGSRIVSINSESPTDSSSHGSSNRDDNRARQSRVRSFDNTGADNRNDIRDRRSRGDNTGRYGQVGSDHQRGGNRHTTQSYNEPAINVSQRRSYDSRHQQYNSNNSERRSDRRY